MTGWTEMGGLPSFLDLYRKISKFHREEIYFFYLVVPPHKKFASVHPDKTTVLAKMFTRKVLCKANALC